MRIGNLIWLAAFPFISSCNAASNYMGIDIRPTSLSSPLAQTASRASRGDRDANLSLAIAFAQGEEVARNCENAIALFRLATDQQGEARWVYVPGVGGARGRVQRQDITSRMTVDAGLARSIVQQHCNNIQHQKLG